MNVAIAELMAAVVALVRESKPDLDDLVALDEALSLGLVTDGEHYMCVIYSYLGAK